MLKARIQLKKDTSEAWRINNPVLLDGEAGYESDTNLMKVGDGIHRWLELDYINSGATAIASTANYAINAGALGGTSAADWAKKFDNYVLNTRIEAVTNWVKSQNFAGAGDITTWEDF